MASTGENNGTETVDVYKVGDVNEKGDKETGQPQLTSVVKGQPPKVDESEEREEQEEEEDEEQDEDEEDIKKGPASKDTAAGNGLQPKNAVAAKKRTSSAAAAQEDEHEGGEEQGPDSKKSRRSYEAADTTSQDAQESVDSSYGAEDSGSTNSSDQGERQA